MSKTVECSGFAWMERPTDTSVPQVWHMTRRVEDVDGQIRSLSAAMWLSLMKMEESSSVPERVLQEYLPSMLTPQTVDNITFVLGEYQESMDVLLEQSLMLEVEMVLMVSVQIQNLFLNVKITMEMPSLIQENFLVMDSTLGISMMMMYQNDQEAVVVTETAAETDCSRSHQLLRELNQLPESSCNPDQLQLLYKRLLIDPVLDGQDLKQLQSVNLFSWNLPEFSPPLL